MTKKHTKKALLTSVLSLLLCFSMLLGTTFAWFTDSASSTGNKIVAGTLDVQLLMNSDGSGYENIGDSSSPIFGEGALAQDENGETLWEPGKTQVAYLAIKNNGNLDLKYTVKLKVENVAKDLYKVMKYAIIPDAQYDSVTAWDGGNAVAVGSQSVSGDVVLAKGETHYFALAIHMDEEAGNDYQGGQVNFDLTVLATQLASEEDSFGNGYDDGAIYLENTSAAVTVPDNATEPEILETKGESGVSATIPVGILNGLPDEVKSLSLGYSDPKVDATAKTITFDAIEIVDQSGKVVDLEALDLGHNVTVTIPVGAAFDDGDLVTVYHDGVIAATAVVENGAITYDVAHFCEVVVKAPAELSVDENGNVTINNLDQLIVFAHSVNNGNTYKGKTVTLAADIDLCGIEWTPIGNSTTKFGGTFNGQGHTISNLYVNDIEASYVGLFGYVNGNAKISGVKLHNVDLTGYSYVGSVAGRVYTGAISDCHVSGEIKLFAEYAYAGGIVGGDYVNLTDCSVIADGMGEIKVNQKTGAGGICGWHTEGGYQLSNCTVKNLNITAWTNLGGITGFVHYQNTIDGCRVENVVLTKTRVDGHPGIGMAAGGWSYNATHAITITNNIFKNITLNGTYVPVASADILHGSEYSGGLNKNFVIENNAAENITNNMIEVIKVTTADELKAAITNAKDGDVIVIANDITVTDKWDSRYGGETAAAVTINGMDNTLKFTGLIHDGLNYHAVFRFTGAATVKNLTFDFSEAEAGTYLRAISSYGDLTVDNCTFIGSDNYTKDNAIVFGDYAQAPAQIDASVSITNCAFINWRRGVSDNENAKEVKSVVISGNTFEGANAYVSAYGDVTFTDNRMDASLVSITSYTNAANTVVTATGNVLDADVVNVIGSVSKVFGLANVTAQDGIIVNAQ